MGRVCQEAHRGVRRARLTSPCSTAPGAEGGARPASPDVWTSPAPPPDGSGPGAQGEPREGAFLAQTSRQEGGLQCGGHYFHQHAARCGGRGPCDSRKGLGQTEHLRNGAAFTGHSRLRTSWVPVREAGT